MIRRFSAVFIACVALLSPVLSAADEVHVRITYNGAPDTEALYDSGEPISIGPANNIASIRLWANSPTTQDIGRVTLNNLGGSQLISIVVSPTGWFGQGFVPSGCRNWGGLANNRDYTRFVGTISGNLTGGVQASAIERLKVGGQLNAWVIMETNPLEGPAERLVEAQSIGTGGRIESLLGDIPRVKVYGDMLGDIFAVNGEIRRIEVDGNIGSPNDHSVITARASATEAHGWEAFELITAQNVYAAITAIGADPNSTSDQTWLQRLEALGTPGELVGSLNVNHINWKESDPAPGIFLNGNLDADLVFGSNLSAPIEVGGSFLAGRRIVIPNFVRTDANDPNPRTGRIVIGGSLLGDIELGGLTVKGLQGFIYANAKNQGGIWNDTPNVDDAEVTIRRETSGGGSVFEPIGPAPEYQQTSASLTAGGFAGAVGEVPLHRHRVDCFPAEPAGGGPFIIDPTTAPTRSNPLLMRQYGPVVWDLENGIPFLVTRRKAGTTTTEDITNCFDQEPMASDPSVVRIMPKGATEKLSSGFIYTVSLNVFDNKGTVENVLRCDVPDDGAPPFFAFQPPVFDSPPMEFAVCSDSDPCMGDADSNGVVNFADTASVLANFNSTSCLTMGDADRNGVVNFTDITAVLTFYNNSYCSFGGQSIRAGGADGLASMDLEEEGSQAASATMQEALIALGYSSIEEFVAAISRMTQEQMETEMHRLGEMLNGGQ